MDLLIAPESPAVPVRSFRYQATLPDTGKSYFVYGKDANEAKSRLAPAITQAAGWRYAGWWDPSTGTVQDDPDPYVVLEGDVIPKGRK